jgi:hypothetical protein
MSAWRRPEEDGARVDISGVCYVIGISCKYLVNRISTYFEYFLGTCEVVDIFHGYEVKERELFELQRKLVS